MHGMHNNSYRQYRYIHKCIFYEIRILHGCLILSIIEEKHVILFSVNMFPLIAMCHSLVSSKHWLIYLGIVFKSLLMDKIYV